MHMWTIILRQYGSIGDQISWNSSGWVGGGIFSCGNQTQAFGHSTCQSAANYMYLHLAPPGRHNLSIVHSHLSLWHLVHALVDDAHTLTHLLHPTQVPAQYRAHEQAGHLRKS